MDFRNVDSRIRGVPAVLVTSRNRFLWTPDELVHFEAHIRRHPNEDERYDDLQGLLMNLDLHGYENMVNVHGEGLYSIIEKKVKDKIRGVRNGMDLHELQPQPDDQESLPGTGLGNEFIEGYNINIVNRANAAGH
ncbi:hypothetical protein F4861DRAFT_92778 [Xylaria intraflava]|nr:hypothetical protein F4861DRAFT_92778 [Xylaria intraflava]